MSEHPEYWLIVAAVLCVLILGGGVRCSFDSQYKQNVEEPK